MSSTNRVALLALVSAAAAVPHYGHSQFHHRPSGTGYAYPTGGFWRSSNATAAYPTGTGSAKPTGGDELTTTVDETYYSTTTVVQTIWETRSAATPVQVKDFSSTAPAGCGPETVYVTATDKVTVTVTPSGAASSAAALAVSSAPAYSAPAYSAAPAPSSAPAASSKGAEKPSQVSQVSQAPSSTPAAPVASSVAPSSAPASSAPAAKPTTPSYSGGKRGLAYNDVKLTAPFAGKASFAYNWGASESGSLPAGAKYVPMCHRPNLWPNPSDWFSAVESSVKSGSSAVMGFNEPDHPDQANLTPDQACSAWKTYIDPLATKFPGLTIIGPSVTNGPAPMGLDWLSRFAQACPGATWHAANIHFYDVYDANTLSRFQAHVEQAAAQVGGKKIWVTEFGLNPGSATAAQAAEFLQGAMKYMDGSDVVQGYSYFMVGTGENQLNTATGLSSVGSVYAS